MSELNGMEQWVAERDDMVIEDDGSITNTETGVNTADDDSGNAPIYDDDTSSWDEAVNGSDTSTDSSSSDSDGCEHRGRLRRRRQPRSVQRHQPRRPPQ
ncbi:hypothetical protein [Haloarcula marina]|uniref:hypothetical protein n=1 Tax=Haloarcula marina TaxID=2961574 RepID=UPI0020B7EAFA|nr:hypothetical protein [Halomicroarcula marina]